ncbi:aromatic ring-hydroxylating dioxygenase subunit alpha (plasmid) [Rhodococcus opacus]|uniref:aromatic ring-hydroxylating oxygenase subunit alpha n=1 Tax=Rhodococcus opacus TaxID=37919 RepID=UPI00146D7C57|nr:aromatic ring-hydroxylating dioxygenase subunit alpha [Rhodococcus opacus]
MGERLDVGDRLLSYQDVLDLDTHEVPKHIRQENRGEFSWTEASIERYTSREWHLREKDRVWKRTWQFVCREENIPDVGDHIVYTVADLQYLVIRSAPNTIRAYPNACLHRGRQLKDFDGWCSEIRCSFHGMSWDLDGALKQIPAPWEFPHVEKDDFSLPAVSVGTWAGFVFINPDPDAEPLDDYLGELTDHFAKWKLEDRYIQAHVSKVLRCNWKVAQEAYMECWHAAATHPQTVPYAAFGVCQVDCYDNFARFVTPSEVVGPMTLGDPTTEEMLKATMDVRVDEDLPVQPLEGETARDFVVRNSREKWRGLIGDEIDDWADCELVDNFTYTVFPNMMPWGGVHRLCYRFRPYGDNHRESIMDVFLIGPYTGERPPPAEEIKLDADTSFGSRSELGLVGNILDQDVYNMEKVQYGMEAASKKTVTFAQYQEDNIRWMHQLMDAYMEED